MEGCDFGTLLFGGLVSDDLCFVSQMARECARHLQNSSMLDLVSFCPMKSPLHVFFRTLFESWGGKISIPLVSVRFSSCLVSRPVSGRPKRTGEGAKHTTFILIFYIM